MKTIILIFLGIVLFGIVLVLLGCFSTRHSEAKSLLDYDEDFINFDDDAFRKELFKHKIGKYKIGDKVRNLYYATSREYTIKEFDDKHGLYILDDHTGLTEKNLDENYKLVK